jgi:predicted esterase
MNNVTVELAAALRERIAIIGDETSRRDPVTHTARLKAISEKIEKLQAALPQSTDPRLAHYLQRRSYDKALEFLERTNVPPSPQSFP